MEDEEFFAALGRWERFFDSGGTAREDLLALDSPDARIGLSRAGVVLTRFICRFEIGRLTFDCTCVTGGADDGEEEPSRWEDALATVRLAILLAHSERTGREWLPNDPQASVLVASDETGVSFRVSNGRGEVCASEEGWDGLLRILERPPEGNGPQIWV